MNDTDELARLRLLDDFLEEGDLPDWRDEIDAAVLMARKALLHDIRAMLDKGAGSSVVSIDRARLRAELHKAIAVDPDTPLTLAARGIHPEDVEALVDDLAELERMITDQPE
jgi:predicted RNA methylase